MNTATKKRSSSTSIQSTEKSTNGNLDENCCSTAVIIAFLTFFMCILLVTIFILIAYAAVATPKEGPPGPPGPPCNCSFLGLTTGQYNIESTKPHKGITTTIKWTRVGSLIQFNLKSFPFPMTGNCEPVYFNGNPIAFEHLPSGYKHALSYPSYFEGGDFPSELKIIITGTNNQMIYYLVCNNVDKPMKEHLSQTSDIFFSWTTK